MRALSRFINEIIDGLRDGVLRGSNDVNLVLNKGKKTGLKPP